jgi:glycosyltransferase involved in cell wall biosynthesis
VTPVVSVVMAAYNASHLVRYAIASLQLQDFADWELIVVSDHCTDDTEAVVAAFADDRIRFIDLPTNSGQQATPNNVGVAAARGEYLAFLNQDDLYLPDHLSANLACIRETGADLICSSYARVEPEQQEKIAAREIAAVADGFEVTGRFSPHSFHIASSWFLRRATALRVGPWRLESETWVTPSQDWLFRVWRSGARIHYSPHISVVVLYSGHRRDSYRKRESAEHDFIFNETIASSRLRPALLAATQRYIAEVTEPELRWRRRRSRNVRKLVPHLLRSAPWALVYTLSTWLGIHPRSFEVRLRHGGRGALIAASKKISG